MNFPPWWPSSYLNEARLPWSESGLPAATLVAHIYYEEFLDRLLDALESGSLKYFAKIIITTSQDEVANRIRALGLPFNISVVKYPNVGRNFAPLFLELRRGHVQTEFLVHVHSKKSPNRPSELSTTWSQRSWNLLLENPRLLERAIRVLRENPNIASVSPLVSDIIPADAFSWLENMNYGSRLASRLGLSSSPSRFSFPAGGMFLVRVDSIRPLINLPWKISWFPQELGQIDGTLQHAVERAVGLVPTLLGYSHAFYDSSGDGFTSEEGFLTFDGHEIRHEPFAGAVKIGALSKLNFLKI